MVNVQLTYSERADRERIAFAKPCALLGSSPSCSWATTKRHPSTAPHSLDKGDGHVQLSHAVLQRRSWPARSIAGQCCWPHSKPGQSVPGKHGTSSGTSSGLLLQSRQQHQLARRRAPGCAAAQTPRCPTCPACGSGRSANRVAAYAWSRQMQPRFGDQLQAVELRQGSLPALTSNTSTSASVSCCCRVKRLRQYFLVREGPQGPQQRTMEPGVTPHSHTRVANLRRGSK